MRRNDIIKDNIKRSVNISHLIEHLTGEKLQGNKICCPFHSETRPSFFVDDKKGVYNCFVCGGGDIFTFVMKYLGFNFPQAIQFIDKEFHLGYTSNKVSVAMQNRLRKRKRQEKEKQIQQEQVNELYHKMCIEYRIINLALPYLEVFSDLWCNCINQKAILEWRLDECMELI